MAMVTCKDPVVEAVTKLGKVISTKHYPTLHRQACLFYVVGGRYRLYDPEKDGVDAHLFEEESLEDVASKEISTEAVIKS